VQKAADVAMAGATVMVRPGVYYERFVIFRNSGTASSPITFKAEPGVIIDHGLRVPSWTADGGGVYRGMPIFPTANDRKEWTNRVVVNQRPLVQAATRQAMSEGTFYVDGATGEVFVWAFGGVNPGNTETVVLNAKDDPEFYMPGIKVWPKTSYVVLDGFTQRGAHTAIEAGFWESDFIGSHVTIRNCTLEYTWQHAVRLSWFGDALIENCTIRQSALVNWPRGSSPWPHAIIGWFADNVIVRNSRIHDNHGEGVGPFTGCSNWQIRNNVVHDNYSVNIYVDTSEDTAVVDGNLVYNDPAKYTDGKQSSDPGERLRNNADGIRVGNEGADITRDDPTPAVTNVTITNNIVIGTGGGIMSFRYFDGSYFLKDSLIANNTVVTNVPGSLGDAALAVSYGENVRVVNNIVTAQKLLLDNGQGAGITAQNNLVQAAAQVQTGRGASASGTVVGSPRFVNGSGFDAANYRLQADSAARDAGLSLSQVTQDYFGLARPQGQRYDIGAAEFTTAPPPTASPVPPGSTPTPMPPGSTPTPQPTPQPAPPVTGSARTFLPLVRR
jgi:hypothetical protein